MGEAHVLLASEGRKIISARWSRFALTLRAQVQTFPDPPRFEWKRLEPPCTCMVPRDSEDHLLPHSFGEG